MLAAMSGIETRRDETQSLGVASNSSSDPAKIASLKTVFEHMTRIAKDQDFDVVTQVFNQIDEQRKSIAYTDEKLNEKKAAIDALTDQYKDLKTEKTRIQSEKYSLQQKVLDKENILSEKLRIIDILEQQILSMKSEIEGYVSAHNKYLENLKLSEKRITDLERSGSSLDERLSLKTQKISFLENEKTSLNQKVEAIEGKLHRLNGYTAGHSTEDEDFMSVFSPASENIFNEIVVLGLINSLSFGPMRPRRCIWYYKKT